MPEQGYVAHGGRTVGSHMPVHSREDCRALKNANAVREATPGEIESREWCDHCTGDVVNDDPDWGAYRAAVEHTEEEADA